MKTTPSPFQPAIANRQSPIANLQWLFLALLAAGCGPPPALTEQPSPQAESCRADPISNTGPTHIRWFGPDRPKDYRELWWRCIGVGPAVVWAPHPPDASSTVDSLIVVSWNVHVGGAHLAEFIQDLKAGRVTAGGPVRDFVLLLQEAYRGGLGAPPAGFIGARALVIQPARPPRVDITETARAFNLHLYYLPSTRNGNRADDREDRGNAILSTQPLDELTAYELPFEIHRRVALSARVAGKTSDGTAWRLTLGVAHLDATLVRAAMWRDLGYGRKRQAVGLAARWSQDPAIVVGGDFKPCSTASGPCGCSSVKSGEFPAPIAVQPGRPSSPTISLPGSPRPGVSSRIDGSTHPITRITIP